MRVLVQRSQKSSVTVDSKVTGQIEKGLVLLVGFTHTDTEEEINYLVDKVLHLRIFNDQEGKMNLSLLDIQGSILSISQFTLYADASKGRRPSFQNALEEKKANRLYEIWNAKLKESVPVETGIFKSDMKVQITNDGPVTIWLEKEHTI